jgi:predicted RNA-binding protein YlxR (DUF448 family)
VGCRAKSAVNVLVRVVTDEEGHLLIGRKPMGRGAWIHSDSVACADLAVQRRAFQRALRHEFSDEELIALRVRLGERAICGEGVGG